MYAPRPLGPGVIATATSRRLRQELEVGHRLGTVAHGSTDTIITSITTTNDDDVLALRVDVSAILQLRIKQGGYIKGFWLLYVTF